MRTAFLAGAAALLGCRPEPSFENVQALVFDVGCAASSCHGTADDTRHKLSLEAGQAYANLVGVDPTNEAARARGWKRVAPRDPAASFILVKLRGPSDDALGRRMPRTAGALEPDLIELVERWIKAGAPPPRPDGGAGGSGGGSKSYGGGGYGYP